MNEPLRRELLDMRNRDLRVREELAADGSLFEGYHPRMEAVHRANAHRLREIIAEHGWPGTSLVGSDGAEAAWLIVQHAIGEPDFCRSCLPMLWNAAHEAEAEPWQAAYLEDRIRMYEGKPQRFGTQLVPDSEGRPQPYSLEDPDGVDARRRAVGLEPLAERIAKAERDPVPRDRVKFEREYEEWLKRVGWR
jgi:hypothetical protein